jgi:pimeloyl-ACP methyl ester carboxylesterase
MRRMLIYILTTVAALYLTLCVVLFLVQRTLLYHPRGASTQTDLVTLPVSNVRVVASTQLHNGPHAAIYLGGNAEDVTITMSELSAAFPDRAIYALHYRGYGGSSGSPSQDALFSDALALFDHAYGKHPEITVIGRSLGSGIAIYLASHRPVARLVLVTPFDSILGIAHGMFPFLPTRWIVRDKFESNRYAASVTAPTSIIAADHDEIIPRSNTELLRTRFRPGQLSYVVIPNTDHNSISLAPQYASLLRGSTP